MEDIGFLGSGSLWVKRSDGGLFDIGNATKLAIKESADSKDRVSRKRDGTYGANLDSVNIKKPAEITIDIDNINYKNMALAFLGDASQVTVNGASLTDESHNAYGEEGLKTLKGQISVVTITPSQVGAGSGYLVNNVSGYNIGDTVIAVDTGSTANIVAGDIVKFGSSDYLYRVIDSTVTGSNPTRAGNITIAGGLKAAAADGAAVALVATLTATTHYTITDARLGIITFTDKVVTVAGTPIPVLVDYTYGDSTYDLVQGGTKPAINLELFLDAENQVDSSRGELRVWNATLAPTSEVDFLSENYQTITLAGKLSVPDGKPSAYEYKANVTYV